MVKKIKYETKRIGYILLINAIVLINALFIHFYTVKDISSCMDITKFTFIMSIVLLLGRKAIAGVITQLVEKVK